LDFSWKGKTSEVVFCFAHHLGTENSELNDAWSLEAARFTVMLTLTCTLQAVFRRFLRPEKDYLSFSLIYKKGERSLDLVRKNTDSLCST
jgi:hypothetical protein